jgi:hypothetical protein
VSTSSVLTEIGRPVPPVPPGPAIVVRRCHPGDGPSYWRWDCRRCGEYGGGRSHPDAITRATRHCGEHPQHRSSLLQPVRCRQRQAELRAAVHPALFAQVGDDAGPPPLNI